MVDPYLCIYGHTAIDQIMSLHSFPDPNTSVDILEKRRYFGGTGSNMAAVAASLGVPTALCSFVGSDFPADFRYFLEGRGIDLRDLVEVEGYETPAVWIVSNEAHDQIAYVYQGPMRDMDNFPLRMSSVEQAKVIHISTGRPEYYLRLMAECRKMGKEISFDPAQEIHRIWSRETFRQALPLCNTFFANQNEMRTAMRYLDLSSPEEITDIVGTFVNTLGRQGSVLCSREGKWRIPAAQAEKVVDTTGAGDAFRAGFYAGKYRGYAPQECAAFGSAAASFIVEERGSVTNIPSWEQVRERANEVLSGIERY